MQLHLFSDDPTPPAPWPVVPPWGDLTGHQVARVALIEPDRHAWLLVSPTGHRWQILTFRGHFYGSQAGWLDADGRNYSKENPV
jgi:hypothetical protein